MTPVGRRGSPIRRSVRPLPPHPRSLLLRLIGPPAVVLALITAIWGWRSWRTHSAHVERTARARIAAVASTLAPQLDGDTHERAAAGIAEGEIESWSEGSAELLELRRLLREVARDNELETDIYTLRVRPEAWEAIEREPHLMHPNALQFVVNTSEYANWGHGYAYRPEMGHALLHGRATTTRAYEDENGEWISAYAPVRDSQGRIVGLLETDATMGALFTSAGDHARQQALLLGLVFAFSVIGLVAAGHSMSRSLSRLEDAALRFGRGDYSAHFPQEIQISEIASLASALEHARERIAGDIEEREQLQRALVEARDAAEQGGQAKASFLANMSHEIRTPMNGIIGMVELLLETELSADQRDLLQTIDHSSEALLTILNDVLDFSKIEAGKLELEEIEFDLRTTIEETIGLLASSARDKEIELHCFLPEALPRNVVGDPSRLRQVLLNLTGNAVKFTSKGEVVIRAEREEGPEGEPWIRFSVRDTGIGIPADRQEGIFEAFQQVDGSTTRRFGGTGLGLAICSQLVELMRGEIGLESELGFGSTFWFRLPMRMVEGDGDAELDLSGRRVLVVDDNAMARGIVEHHLREWGASVEGFENAKGALAALGQPGQPLPALIFCDLCMPEVDGHAFVRHAELLLGPQRPPVVAISGFSERVYGVDWQSGGFVDFLAKPFRRAGLKRCVERVLFGGRGSKEPLESPRAALPSVGASSDGPLRLLLVEDNPVNQKVTLRLLQRFGYEAEVAENGQRALELHEKGGFSAVLMDCQMPVMDGFEATRQIRLREARELSDERIPIIALTANAMSEDRQRVLDAGMDDYLPKPVRAEELAKALVRWCRRDASACDAADASA